jgi:2-(1,2-epoxy-1,2-dihydrophenyl)acetyl-CoA isomerase
MDASTEKADSLHDPDDEILRERQRDNLLLTINRPRVRNALGPSTVSDLAAAIESAPATGARTIILMGAGSSFSAGGDLPQIAAVAASGALAATDIIYGKFHRLVNALRSCPLPVIAAVNGPALGAGLDLALLCDIRVAARSASFASSWISAGLVPGMGGAGLLSALIGGSRATSMVLTGRRISADAAEEYGLVEAVVADEDLLTYCNGIASSLADLSAVALARSKAALRRIIERDLDRELSTLGAIQGSLLTGPDFRAVAARFAR